MMQTVWQEFGKEKDSRIGSGSLCVWSERIGKLIYGIKELIFSCPQGCLLILFLPALTDEFLLHSLLRWIC